MVPDQVVLIVLPATPGVETVRVWRVLARGISGSHQPGCRHLVIRLLNLILFARLRLFCSTESSASLFASREPAFILVLSVVTSVSGFRGWREEIF